MIGACPLPIARCLSAVNSRSSLSLLFASISGLHPRSPLHSTIKLPPSGEQHRPGLRACLQLSHPRSRPSEDDSRSLRGPFLGTAMRPRRAPPSLVCPIRYYPARLEEGHLVPLADWGRAFARRGEGKVPLTPHLTTESDSQPRPWASASVNDGAQKEKPLARR